MGMIGGHVDNDNYIYELEQALTKLLDQFEPHPSLDAYTIYDDLGDPITISEDMSLAVDHANEILYGDSYNDD